MDELLIRLEELNIEYYNRKKNAVTDSEYFRLDGAYNLTCDLLEEFTKKENK